MLYICIGLFIFFDDLLRWCRNQGLFVIIEVLIFVELTEGREDRKSASSFYSLSTKTKIADSFASASVSYKAEIQLEILLWYVSWWRQYHQMSSSRLFTVFHGKTHLEACEVGRKKMVSCLANGNSCLPPFLLHFAIWSTRGSILYLGAYWTLDDLHLFSWRDLNLWALRQK